MQITPLPAFDYLRVSGADARNFLQGQLTCNLDLLNGQTALPGAICNLKGRVIANFIVLPDGDACLLQTVAGAGAKLQETLAKYAVFSKVELELIAGPETVYGIIGDVATAFAEVLPAVPDAEYACLVTADYRLLRLPGPSPRYQLWCLTETAVSRLHQPDVIAELQELPVWQRADIAAGIINVTPAMSEEFTPQLLNYDISGAVDFTKGCYTGQEVVARMYYRGKAKKRMYLLSSDHAIDMDSKISGTDQARPEDKVAQILANTGAVPYESFLALAILPTALAEADPAPILNLEGKYPVEILPMPYTE